MVLSFIATMPVSAYNFASNAYVRSPSPENIDSLFAVSKYGLGRS